MVTLTFPDGARRDYPSGITGLDVAKGISPSLAKRTVAMAVDGALRDLSDAMIHARWSSSGTMPLTCSRKRCRRSGQAHR